MTLLAILKCQYWLLTYVSTSHLHFSFLYVQKPGSIHVDCRQNITNNDGKLSIHKWPKSIRASQCSATRSLCHSVKMRKVTDARPMPRESLRASIFSVALHANVTASANAMGCSGVGPTQISKLLVHPFPLKKFGSEDLHPRLGNVKWV